ncbi:MAG: tetratricopeptide repeat-containing protein [Chloroflexi bacterium]|nr:tetratricopeptide repeat-containing protein [Chloroflexota bacterium]
MPLKKLPPQYQSLVYQVKRDPANADAWEALGDLLSEAGDTRRAEECYRRVLALRPDDLEAQISYQHLQSGGAGDSLNGVDALVSGLEKLSLDHLPLWFQVFLAFFSFLVTLMLARLQNWQTTDLVWSLWISSLTLGYAYLLTGIAAKALRSGMGLDASSGGNVIQELAPTPLRWALSIGGALFTLAFFTIHFGMFHLVHSVFLNQFFPLVRESGGFPNVFEFIRVCIVNYWPVILLSALSQLPNFMRAAETQQDRMLMMPYLNVVKMHLSIFVFAGLSAMQVSSAALVYLLVLYFFPFGALVSLLKRPKPAPENA